MAAQESIGFPYFAWTTEDVEQDGVTISAYGGRICPECGFVVTAKTTKSREDYKHWSKAHA